MKLRTPFENFRGKVTLVIYTKPRDCGGKCIYCFSQKGIPNSFIENEDTIRAKECDWDPACQLEKLFNLYKLNKGIGNKCDISVLGGSFTNYTQEYLVNYAKRIYDFLNGVKSPNLDEAIKMQEKAPDRCVIFSIETRPDLIDENWCEFLLSLGVTLVEIGVQSLNDRVLEVNQRCYDKETVKRATYLLRKYGFKIGYHMMVGMPSSNWDIDLEILSNRLWEKEFCPDYLKIYPCILLKGNYHQKRLSLKSLNEWIPLTDKMYNNFLFEIKPYIPPFVKVSRIQRLIPPKIIMKGPSSEIDRKKFDNICKCISHRAVGWRDYNLNGNFSNFSIRTYNQGDGFYVEAVLDKDTILGYGRVSFNQEQQKAIIREIRVFGRMLGVGEPNSTFKGIQHIGIGKSIMKKLEELSLKKCYNYLEVNSGIGVREYFEKLGYNKSRYYMAKKLPTKIHTELY